MSEVLNAIRLIEECKRRERHVPAHATTLEVVSLTGLTAAEVRREAAKLSEAGQIHIGPTINEDYYQPVGISDNIELTETQ